MKEPAAVSFRKPKIAALAVVFYVLAGVCVLVGIGISLFGLRGDLVTAHREVVPSLSGRGWIIVLNSASVALVLGVAGVLVNWLHEMREYVKMIAKQLTEKQPTKGPSEN